MLLWNVWCFWGMSGCLCSSANHTDTTRSCQRATRRTNVGYCHGWKRTKQLRKGGDVQIVVYSRQLSQLEQIIVHFGCWPSLRLATSPFTYHDEQRFQHRGERPAPVSADDSQWEATVSEPKHETRRGSDLRLRDRCGPHMTSHCDDETRVNPHNQCRQMEFTLCPVVVHHEISDDQLTLVIERPWNLMESRGAHFKHRGNRSNSQQSALKMRWRIGICLFFSFRIGHIKTHCYEIK